jgi:hypothetical protein
LVNVAKVQLLRSAAYNLGLLLRKVWGMGKPRSWEAGWAAALAAAAALLAASGRPLEASDALTTVIGVISAFFIVRRSFEGGFSFLFTGSRKSSLF